MFPKWFLLAHAPLQPRWGREGKMMISWLDKIKFSHWRFELRHCGKSLVGCRDSRSKCREATGLIHGRMPASKIRFLGPLGTFLPVRFLITRAMPPSSCWHPLRLYLPNKTQQFNLPRLAGFECFILINLGVKIVKNHLLGFGLLEIDNIWSLLTF